MGNLRVGKWDGVVKAQPLKSFLRYRCKILCKRDDGLCSVGVRQEPLPAFGMGLLKHSPSKASGYFMNSYRKFSISFFCEFSRYFLCLLNRGVIRYIVVIFCLHNNNIIHLLTLKNSFMIFCKLLTLRIASRV